MLWREKDFREGGCSLKTADTEEIIHQGIMTPDNTMEPVVWEERSGRVHGKDPGAAKETLPEGQAPR